MNTNPHIAKSCVCFLITLLVFSSSTSFSQTHTIDSLLTELKTARQDTSTALLYGKLCRAYMAELNDMEKVREYASKAYTLSETIHFRKGMGYGISYRGLCEWAKGNFQMALNDFKRARELFKGTDAVKTEGACLINIGQVYFELGKFQEALEYTKQGTRISEVIKDEQSLQSGYISIGNIYIVQGNFPEAINYFFKCLKIAEARNDLINASFAYNNIGDVFYAQNKLDMALVYYQKAVKHLEKIKEERVAGSIYTGIGTVYWKKKQYDLALVYHLKDLHAKEKFADKQGVAVACNKIGFDYFGQKKFAKALPYQLKSYQMCKQISFKKGIIDACGGVGKVYTEQKEFAKALNYFSEMLSTARELDYREGIRDAYENLAIVYAKMNEFEKSLTYTELFHGEKDSLLNKENFKQIAELNTRYDTDKKEKEIQLLTKDQALNAKIIKQQQLVRWGLMGGLGLLSISVFSIYRRYRYKQRANVILERQKDEIEYKNTLITDSIDYAQSIQQAVLPAPEVLKTLFPESFMLHKPKSTVSGDFYWICDLDTHLICAVADCTGHGVPGAFMSLLGYNMLENIVKTAGITEPDAILNALDKEMLMRLTENPEEDSRHGMDISLISIHKTTQQLSFAGAHNPLYLIREGKLSEFKADKTSIGGKRPQEHLFQSHTFQIRKGDQLFIFTDGFPDQIGGANHKKFYYQPFKELLLSISSLSPDEQRTRLDKVHTDWMGKKKDQTDDILILGIRY